MIHKKRATAVTKKDNCYLDTKKRASVVTKKLIVTMIRKKEQPRSQKKLICVGFEKIDSIIILIRIMGDSNKL